MYSQKHGKRQLSIGISFTNWFTQMFDDLFEPSHLLSGLQPIDLGIWKIVCAMAQGLDHQKDANQIWNTIEKRLMEMMNP